MPNINYFTYNFSIEALYDTESTIGNTMLYQTTFELVKGTDNQIFIHLKNHDRKAVYLPGKHIVAHLINQEEDKTYYVQNLDIIDSAKGKYKLVFRKNKIEKIPVGHYRLVLVAQNCEQEIESLDNIENLLYTGEDYRPIMDVKVVNGVFERARKSFEVTTYNFRNDTQWYYSDAIDMTKLIDRDSHLVSISLLLKRFVGDIIVEGCYEENPTDVDTDWVELAHKQYSIDTEIFPLMADYEMQKMCFGYNWKDVEQKECCVGFNVKSMCHWIRIKYKTYIFEECPCELKSTIEKTLVRS